MQGGPKNLPLNKVGNKNLLFRDPGKDKKPKPPFLGHHPTHNRSRAILKRRRHKQTNTIKIKHTCQTNLYLTEIGPFGSQYPITAHLPVPAPKPTDQFILTNQPRHYYHPHERESIYSTKTPNTLT